MGSLGHEGCGQGSLNPRPAHPSPWEASADPDFQAPEADPGRVA